MKLLLSAFVSILVFHFLVIKRTKAFGKMQSFRYMVRRTHAPSSSSCCSGLGAGSSTQRRYFDDISRSTMDFLPSSEEGEWRSFLTNRTYTEEKAFALKALLTGHDAATASDLTDSEIIDEVSLWADRSGLVGQAYGDELYENLLGMTLCRSDTLIGCLASYWETIVTVLQNDTDSERPRSRSEVSLLVFPDCPLLYHYKRMAMLTAAMEISQGLCTHLGRTWTLTLFHPTYKNAPKMMSPARHAPFPTAGLQRITKPRLGEVAATEEDERTTTSYEYHGDMKGDYIPNIHERRRTLELLFRSAAADTPILLDLEQTLSPEAVRQQTVDWMEGNNERLLSASTSGDRWTVTDSAMGEQVYASIWKAIHELSLLGQHADHVAWEQRESIPIDPLAWTNILSDRRQHAMMTSMFVAPKFHTYHAQRFKRFAITVNAVLKKITAGTMFIELLHPEYVGATEVESQYRRTPFPTIQICYQVQAKKKKKSEWKKI